MSTYSSIKQNVNAYRSTEVEWNRLSAQQNVLPTKNHEMYRPQK